MVDGAKFKSHMKVTDMFKSNFLKMAAARKDLISLQQIEGASKLKHVVTT